MGTSLIRIGGIVGLLSLLAYFGAAFLPLPDAIGYLLVFAMGPLLSLSFLGVYAALTTHRRSVPAYFGCALGFAAGVVVNLMLVIQGANNILRERGLAEDASEVARQASEIVWRAVNRVQSSVDVSWDIFISAAGILIAIAMLSHPRFGRIFGWSGITSSAALLILNLWTFPIAPAYAGLIDLGPLVALWFMAVFVRMLMPRGWGDESTKDSPAPAPADPLP